MPYLEPFCRQGRNAHGLSAEPLRKSRSALPPTRGFRRSIRVRFRNGRSKVSASSSESSAIRKGRSGCVSRTAASCCRPSPFRAYSSRITPGTSTVRSVRARTVRIGVCRFWWRRNECKVCTRCGKCGMYSSAPIAEAGVAALISRSEKCNRFLRLFTLFSPVRGAPWDVKSRVISNGRFKWVTLLKRRTCNPVR